MFTNLSHFLRTMSKVSKAYLEVEDIIIEVLNKRYANKNTQKDRTKSKRTLKNRKLVKNRKPRRTKTSKLQKQNTARVRKVNSKKV